MNSVPEKIRLTGIDCPEHDQPFGKEATHLTKQLALEKAVKVTESAVTYITGCWVRWSSLMDGCSIVSWSGREPVGGIENMHRAIRYSQD